MAHSPPAPIPVGRTRYPATRQLIDRTATRIQVLAAAAPQVPSGALSALFGAALA